MKLNEASDNVPASKSDPDSLFLSHCTFTVNTEQQTDERTKIIDKELMKIDHMSKIYATASFS